MVQKLRKAKPQQKQEKVEKSKISKFIKKKSKNAAQTKRDNTYVFEGFYEKLKQIDVKQSNALETNFMYDSVLRQSEENEEEGLFNSNFIQLLRSERANNKTIEFGRVYKVLEPFCFSYPLLVLNKSQVVTLMLYFLNPSSARTILNETEETQSVQNELLKSVLSDDQPLFAIQVVILDLMVALIKDFRQDIYQDFVAKILPAVISVIDMQKVLILDKVFMVISFGIKYLSKSIKDDIQNFYSSYSELLIHKNRYLRKFASQSLSYVLRKLTFDQKTIQMVANLIQVDDSGNQHMEDKNEEASSLSIINDKEMMGRVLGTSDMLFEVVYGAGEGLHSKFQEVMNALIEFYKNQSIQQHLSTALEVLLRCLILKLANEVDTEKQQPLYDLIDKGFDHQEDEKQLNLVLRVFKDQIRLKYGKRLSNYGIITMISVFNKLLTKNITKVLGFDVDTKVNIVQTLSILYYFKHNNVKSILAKSNIDINDQKNLFTSFAYKLIESSKAESIKIYESYLDLLLRKPHEIQSFDDLDWSQVLGLKQSSKNLMEFSADSHQAKVQVLIKSVNKFTLAQIASDVCSPSLKIQLMAVFIGLRAQVSQKLEIELGEKVETALLNIVKDLSKNDSQRDSLFVLLRYLSFCKTSRHFIQSLTKDFDKRKQLKETASSVSLQKLFEENIILKKYGLSSERQEHLDQTLKTIIDTYNVGDTQNLNNQIKVLTLCCSMQHSQEHFNSLVNQVKNNTQDIVHLKAINSVSHLELNLKSHSDIFANISNNLMKNQQLLRTESLLILTRFEKLQYLDKPFQVNEQQQNQDLEKSELYNGPCLIINLMLQFEQTKISFETEKTKILLIKKIEALLNTGLVPLEYVQVAFKFLIGCFWIKFTPIFEAVQEALNSIIYTYGERAHSKSKEGASLRDYAHQILTIIRDLGLILQLTHENQDIENIIKADMTDSSSEKQSLSMRCYLREAVLDADYLEIKDFYFNLTKTLHQSIDLILESHRDSHFLFETFYEFIDNEYSETSANKVQKANSSNLVDRMTLANMIDSEEYRQFRKITYSKLYCFIELLHSAEKLVKLPRLQDFQALMLKLTSSSDTKLQKLALECLIKTDFKGGILRHYRKLLEGLADDEKFKDTIAAVNFGSSKQQSESQSYPSTTADGDQQKKQDKSAIPKLQDIHRMDVLPVIIKLLLSKLARKKGAINQKSIHVRRNIVFNFMSSLKTREELDLFVNELLLCFDLKLNDTNSEEVVMQKLSSVSFNVYINFVNQLSVVIKHIGTTLSEHMTSISKVLIAIMSLTKLFSTQMKQSLVTSPTLENEDQDMSEDEEGEGSDSDKENDQDNIGSKKESLYRFVGKQSKMCLRKSLSVVLDIYKKFNHLSSFVKQFSADFYSKIAEDQLDLFSTNYITDKSQLIEVVTTQWSANLMTLQNYSSYPKVLPSLFGMLSQPKISSEVYELHFQMLKTLLQKAIAGEETKKDIFAISKAKKRQGKDSRNQDDEQDQEMEDIDNEVIAKEREVSKSIITRNITCIAQSLNEFAKNNINQMKATLYQKKQFTSRHIHQLKNNTKSNASDSESSQSILKDFVFIISEVVTYLSNEDQINSEFLDMCVSILSLKPLHSEYSNSSGSTSFTEDLLLYGCKSVCMLLTKCSKVTQEQVEKILIMFLTLKSLKVRNVLSRGLLENVFSENSKFGKSLGISRECIEVIFNLNKVKKGLADVELDYDAIIKTIEKLDDKSFQKLTHFEIRAISYSIVFLLQSEEFAVRDFSNHYFKKLLDFFGQLMQKDIALFQKEYGFFLQSYEAQLLHFVKTIHDELVLKTVLEALRNLVIFLSDHQQQVKSSQNIHCLIALVGREQDQEDFFTKFLAIKLKSRAKSMQFLIQKLDSSQLNDYRAIQAVIIPLLNYVIFGSKQQKENRRNTVTYSREERRMTMDEALKAYQAIAKQLKWADYYKMLKQLVFKLNKITNKAGLFALSGVSSKSEDSHQQKERIITKCICKVLNGFNFSEVNDAVNDLDKTQMEIDEVGQDQDFQNLLTSLKQNQIIASQDNEELSGGESEDEEKQEAILDKAISKKDQAKGQGVEQDIQNKLYHRVLPILERHLTDYEEQEGQDKEKNGEVGMNHGYGSIRSFVVLSITRLIRKLPRDQFEIQLGKLINNIISKGLRSRLLVHREKARKGLLKLLIEVTPRYLSLVFTLMNDLLTRGYQLQTYIFTILYLLQQLQEKKILQTGMITHKVLEITGEKVMDELFGELNTEQKHAGVEDQQKNKIKEAKGKKAVPIFELYAQYIDFKKNFFTLLGPILRSLDGNPSIGKIQQCEELLNRLSGALMKNQSVKGDQLLMFMYSIIEKGVGMAARIKINEYDGAKVMRDYGAKVLNQDMFIKTKEEYREQTYKVEMKWAKGNSLIDQKKAEELSGRVMASFGLMCLKKALKNKGLILSNESDNSKHSKSNNKNANEEQVNYLDEDLNTQIKKGSEEVKEELKAKLDPFVSVLLGAFKTYHNPIVVSTLHVLGMIINLGLPSFKSLMKKFLNRLFKLFEQTSTSSANQDLDFINSLFKCTAELIKTYSTYQDLTPQQLKTLLFVIKSSLNSSGGNNPHMINVFHLLRALVFRKFLSAELYDIIDKNVQDLMITSLSSSIRSICSSIFVTFLLEYPLEESRLSQHFNHLLKHLGTYFDSEGRHQVLEIMERLCTKMPQPILDGESEKWSFTLMTRLVNEKNKRCKEKVKAVLSRLFQKISQPKTKAIYNTLIEMKVSAEQSETKKQAITQARLQLIGVIVETQSSLVKSKNEINLLFTSLLWPQIVQSYDEIKQQLDEKKAKKLRKAQGEDSQDEEEEDAAASNPEFKKFLKSIELIEDNQEGKGFSIQDYESEDKESWSSLYFALDTVHKLLSKEDLSKLVIEIIKKTPQALRSLLLINSNHHIYWIKLSVQKILQKLLESMQTSPKESLLTIFNLQSESEALKQSLSYLNSYKNLPMTQELKQDILTNSTLLIQSLMKLVKEEDSQKGVLQMLFSRLSLFGRKVMLNIQYSQERLDCILSFFKSSLSLFESLQNSKDNALTREVCEPIMQLVYRVYTDEQYQANSAPKTLSFEIVDYFSQHLEKGFFLRLYNDVKQSILDKRLERKRQYKVMQVSNAAEWEKIKTVKRDKKRDKKKEKKRQEKMRLALTKT